MFKEIFKIAVVALVIIVIDRITGLSGMVAGMIGKK